MNKCILTLIVFVISIGSSLAQKTEFTLEDAIIGRWTKFRPTGPSQLGWIPSKNSIYWISTDTANPSLMSRNIPGENELLVSLNELKKIDELKNLKRFPRIKWINSNEFILSVKSTVYSYGLATKKLEKLYEKPKSGQFLDISSSNNLAYTKGQNLYVSMNGIETAVTNDSVDGIVNGQSVHRYEFGISKGTFWSNKGDQLAFYRKDESMVTNYPLANYTKKPAEYTPVRYPMAGMASHQVTLGIFNTKSKKVTWVKTEGPKDQYLTNIAWGPNDKYLYIAVLNRDQNEVKLNQYDALTGQYVQTLFEEKSDKYVQPLHAMLFLPNNSDQFIWQSERDGYNHLYLYNTQGKLIKQLTKGDWVVTNTHGFDKDNNLIFSKTSNRGMDRLVSRVSTKTAKETPWITESGTHRIKVSSSGEWAIDSYSSLDVCYQLSILNSKGKSIDVLKKVDNPAEDYNITKPELITIKANDGTPLNARVFKPVDFDASKKYKALVYVYNGPGVQLITNTWMGGAALWMPYMANKGYVVFTVDGRGSENRGRDFEQAIFRNLGELEVMDQLAGVQYLKDLPYVDEAKMAVHGWSYGGFMTTSLMLKSPKTFQVGVAGGPVIDWKYYEIMYTERYMDTPETNEAGYAKASLLDKVQNLKGDLLLIHGADDDVVVPQHSIDFIKHCVDQGVQVDFFLYPGHKHNVRGKDRVHLMEKVLEYIDGKL